MRSNYKSNINWGVLDVLRYIWFPGQWYKSIGFYVMGNGRPFSARQSATSNIYLNRVTGQIYDITVHSYCVGAVNRILGIYFFITKEN